MWSDARQITYYYNIYIYFSLIHIVHEYNIYFVGITTVLDEFLARPYVIYIIIIIIIALCIYSYNIYCVCPEIFARVLSYLLDLCVSIM